MFLAEFDFIMEYKPGRIKLVVDALSRKVELIAASQPNLSLEERVRQVMALDVQGRQLLALARAGKPRRFVADGDVLQTASGCLYVPNWAELRKEIIRECHDSLWARGCVHAGID